MTQSNSFLKDTTGLVWSAGTVGLSRGIVPVPPAWPSKCSWLPGLPQLVNILFSTHIFNPDSWTPWCFGLYSVSACGSLLVPLRALSPPAGTLYYLLISVRLENVLEIRRVLHVWWEQASKHTREFSGSSALIRHQSIHVEIRSWIFVSLTEDVQWEFAVLDNWSLSHGAWTHSNPLSAVLLFTELFASFMEFQKEIWEPNSIVVSFCVIHH